MTTDSAAAEWPSSCGEKNDASWKTKSRLNANRRSGDSNMSSVGMDVGRRIVFQLEPFPRADD
jgi:hypothetical protein